MVSCGDGSKPHIKGAPTSHSMHVGNPGGPRPAVVSSMLDVSMGEVSAGEALDALREFNIANKVQAPTKEDFADALVDHLNETEAVTEEMPIVDVEFLRDAGLEVLDFTGDVDGGGIKMSMYDDFVTKPPMELVPMALTQGAARALGYGAAKYAPNNWRRGMRWGEVFGALKRHLDAWNEEENKDKDSGLCHLDHAAANLAFLMHMAAHEAYSKMDDRP